MSQGFEDTRTRGAFGAGGRVTARGALSSWGLWQQGNSPNPEHPFSLLNTGL